MVKKVIDIEEMRALLEAGEKKTKLDSKIRRAEDVISSGVYKLEYWDDEGRKKVLFIIEFEGYKHKNGVILHKLFTLYRVKKEGRSIKIDRLTSSVPADKIVEGILSICNIYKKCSNLARIADSLELKGDLNKITLWLMGGEK